MKKELELNELDENMRTKATSNDIKWYSAKDQPMQLRGLAWFTRDGEYRRLPNNPTYEITEAVDQLANCTTGVQLLFQTDARKLAIKVKLSGKANMNHMPATGQCGFDCYIGPPNRKKFVDVTKYDHTQQEYEVTFFERDHRDLINVTLNFPLYQGVESVQIGIEKQAQLVAPPAYDNSKKVIFYGTSITQGGCASRPGMAYTNILSRRFNLEFINLGFSGNGKGEANMAKLISEIDNPACLVLDYEPNCVSTSLYKQTLPTFIREYRNVHPQIPILVVSKFPYAQELVNKQAYKDRKERLEFQRELIKKLRQSGDEHIYFYEGTDLLEPYTDECTVDGVHPNDLGFMRMADQLEPVLDSILRKV